MKKWLGILMVLGLVFLPIVAFCEQEFLPQQNLVGAVGKSGKAWRLGSFGQVQLPEISAPSGNPPANTGWLYVKDLAGASALYFENDAGSVANLTAGSSTAWDDIGAPDANKTLAFTTYTSLLTGTSTAADQWTFSGRGNFGDVSVVRIESSAGNPTDGTVLEVVSHDTDADALLVTANSINTIQVAGSGNLNLLGGTGTVTYTDWAFTADGLLTLTPDLGGTGITITPSAGLTTGLDVSSAQITNGVNLGATKLLGTTAVIDFTNFDVAADGDVTCVDLTASGTVSVGTFKQDALVPSSASPSAITLNGAGTGGITIGGVSTGTITLGGGSVLVNLPSTVDLTLAGGQLTITDTANANVVAITNNTMTTASAIAISATATTSGKTLSITEGNAILTGDAIYVVVTDGAGFTGNYIRFYDGTGDDFRVARYGATTITGLASTDMLTMTLGDLQITAGDIDVDLGIITVDNTADEGNRIARNNATGTLPVLEIEQTDAGGGVALLVDTKNTTAGEYAIDITSSGATQIHFTANGAAGIGMLYDATNAWTGQAFVIDAGPWLGTLNRGVIDFRSDNAATAEVGSVLYILMQGTTADAAAIDGKGINVHDNAAYTAGSHLVRLDSKNNNALHISNEGAAADGIKFDVAASYTGQGIVANLAAWLGTTDEGFIDIYSTAAATVPAGMFLRMRQLGTGQHAAAIAGTLIYAYDDAAAPAAGVSYAVTIQADHIEALSVPVGKVNVTETVTATGGVSAGNASTSTLLTDVVTLSNANIKALRGTKKTLVASPGAGKFIEVISVILIMDYGTNVLTESADDLVVQYGTSGDDITAAIEMTGFIDQAADMIMTVYPIHPQPANVITDLTNNVVELFNTGDGEFGGNAGADTTMTVVISYRIHDDGVN